MNFFSVPIRDELLDLLVINILDDKVVVSWNRQVEDIFGFSDNRLMKFDTNKEEEIKRTFKSFDSAAERLAFVMQNPELRQHAPLRKERREHDKV